VRSLKKGYGLLKKSISFFILVFFLMAPYPAKSEEYPATDRFLKSAMGKKLYDDRYWHVLLHYKPSRSGYKSLIDDPHFFLASDGKQNPKAELEATIRALFNSSSKDDKHPKCRFIARYEWLKEKLAIDDSMFSDVVCKDFNNLIENVLQPQSVVMVFPAFYMNNPASMFGHTLLRIDSSYESKLLSHAVNYAAYMNDSGLLYPIKGIIGYYKGFFRVFPYYETVLEYNDTDQRDMWEYHLDLTKEEVRKMVMHLWELKGIYSYYYFFDENCSYNLLFLLEAARPSLNLTENAGIWVIPVDTIRAVVDSGLVEKTEFRPAMATRIRYIASSMNESSQETAMKIADNELDPEQIPDTDDNGKIKILDLAIEMIQYKYNRKKLTKDEYTKQFLSALKTRSRLNKSDESSVIPVPVQPDRGHFSSRFSIGIGAGEDSMFQELRYRPGYHSLTDPDDGYLEGSQIVFTDMSLRYYTDGRLQLDALDVIDIVSLTPRTNLFKPVSWRVKTGITRKPDMDGKEHLVCYLDTGFGVAYKNKYIGLYYALADASLNLGSGFRDSYAAGAGVSAGVIRKITDSWKIDLSVTVLFYGLGESFRENRITAVQSYRIGQNNSVELSLSQLEIFNTDRPEIKLSWNHFF